MFIVFMVTMKTLHRSNSISVKRLLRRNLVTFMFFLVAVRNRYLRGSYLLVVTIVTYQFLTLKGLRLGIIIWER